MITVKEDRFIYSIRSSLFKGREIAEVHKRDCTINWGSWGSLPPKMAEEQAKGLKKAVQIARRCKPDRSI